jgi:hypothetical protein
MRRLLSAVAIGVMAGAVSGNLRAADDGLPVYTDRAHTDDDFAFQGEYQGWQRSMKSLRTSQRVGLQVVARSDGAFDAMKYPGGLPGQGGANDNRSMLHGQRDGDTVFLTGEPFDIAIKNGVGTVLTKQGKKTGELRFIRRTSPTMGLAPPDGAVKLFTGGDAPLLTDARITPEGWLMAGTQTVNSYRNFRLHGEFLLPYKPAATGQARGNSGFYLQSRYEVQVLDSFGLEGVNNECGGLYKSIAPCVNMCLPPLEWQTYDIDFREPVFDSQGRKLANARITVWHNGVLIHDNVEIPNKTGGGSQEGPEPLPIKLQDHSNPVFYRNLWLLKTNPDEADDWSPVPGPTPPLQLVGFNW